MRRDRFSGTGSSEDGETTTERTGLMRHSSYLGPYPYFGSSSDRFDRPQRDDSYVGAMVREENMTAYYRQTFTVRGISVGLRDVTQVRRHRLQRCFPQALAPKVACESVTAFLGAGQLHALVDADGTAAKALVKVVAGETPCHSGVVVLGDGYSSAKDFREVVGVVSRSSVAVIPGLTVTRNLRFALDMRTRGNRSWKRLMIQSMTAFVGINPSAKARELNPVEQFNLQLAMELVLDPPVVIVVRPFTGFDFVSRALTAAMLKRISVILQKTVLVTSSSLGPHLFDIADTTLLFGGGGRVLYSGPTTELVPYFNGLRIPRHRREAENEVGVAGEEAPSGSMDAAHSRQSCSLRGGTVGSETEFGATPRPQPHRLSDDARAQSASRGRTGGCGKDNDDDEEGSPQNFFQTPLRISSLLFTDPSGTPRGGIAATAANMNSSQKTVRVYSGEDAVDLAVEWAENDAQTMYYAAKFYDSQVHQRLIEAVEALANENLARTAGDHGLALALRIAEPQRALWKPVILLSYFTHQALSEAEFLLGTVGLLVAMLIVSLLMHFQPQDQGGMYNIRGILFLLFSLVLITNEATMGTIAEQLKLFVHQRNSGLYGTLCFVFCLTVQVIMVRALYLVLLVPFVLSVVQASKGVVALVGVISVTHALLLYTVYALVPSRRFAAWAAHAYFGFSLICSGFLLNLRTMPEAFGGASMLRWGYGPALKERLQGKGFSCDGMDNTSYCYTGEEYLAIQGFTHDSFATSAAALSIMGGVCLVVFTLALMIR